MDQEEDYERGVEGDSTQGDSTVGCLRGGV